MLLLELYDFTGNAFKVGLIDNKRAQEKHRLAVSLVRIEQSGVAGFVNIAHQHGRS